MLLISVTAFMMCSVISYMVDLGVLNLLYRICKNSFMSLAYGSVDLK